MRFAYFRLLAISAGNQQNTGLVGIDTAGTVLVLGKEVPEVPVVPSVSPLLLRSSFPCDFWNIWRPFNVLFSVSKFVCWCGQKIHPPPHTQ